MGHHESPCALCGMRFETGRIRTAQEPQSAAWTSYYGPPESINCLEPECKFVARRRAPRHAGANEDEDAAEGESESRWLPDPSKEHFHGVRTRRNENDEDGKFCPAEFLEDGKGCLECKSGDTPIYMLEHIAGPRCRSEEGYNGNNISCEEMWACNTAQSLVPRVGFVTNGDFAPESDDEDFERETDYFLTGLAETLGPLESDSPVYPVRHGVDDAYPAEDDGFSEGNMPFHPFCFEAYKRVSQWRRGKVDIVELAHWFDREPASFPDHPAVERGRDQWWYHDFGDEFLAANPIHVPALPAIIEASRRTQLEFDVKDSPFLDRETESKGGSDCFGALPDELRHMVLESLGSRDIANLRLASRTFRHLPIWLWHDLMLKEMPWFWEAWSDMPYSFWACTTKQGLEDHDRAMLAREDNIATSSEFPEEEKKRQKDLATLERAKFRQPRPVARLERTQTDWHFLYRQIKRDWKNLQGLKNRERIWTTLEYIVRRIDKPDEDRMLALDEHAKEHPFSEKSKKK